MIPKYVVIDKYLTCGKNETIFIFPPWITHKDFCKAMAREGEKILSAGFVNLNTKQCYGKSTSLNIGSREIDDMYLKLLFKEV